MELNIVGARYGVSHVCVYVCLFICVFMCVFICVCVFRGNTNFATS